VSNTSRNNIKRLEWSALADRNLFEAWTYIFQDNPTAADQIAKRIHQAAGRLIKFPKIGRLSGYHQTRVLPVDKTPFTIYYRITVKSVIIIRLVHQRQNCPK
jgi:plasmid stabilization system protein ParE